MATRWRPDTCDCVVQYEGDAVFVVADYVCPKHAGLDGQALLDKLLAHNRRKNHVLNDLVEQGFDLQDLEVGYDRAADPSDDPVLIRGVGRGLGRKALRVGNRSMNADDVKARLEQRFQGAFKIVE